MRLPVGRNDTLHIITEPGVYQILDYWLERLPPQARLLNRSEIPARILNGGETLSERELEILRRVVKGRSNNEIAAELTLSLHTLKTHVGNTLAKLEVASRSQAIARAHELNLL